MQMISQKIYSKPGWCTQPFGDHTHQRDRASCLLYGRVPGDKDFRGERHGLASSVHFILRHAFIHSFVHLFSHLHNIDGPCRVSQAVGIKSESAVPALRVMRWAQWWTRSSWRQGPAELIHSVIMSANKTMAKVSALEELQLLYGRKLVCTDLQGRTSHVEADP